MEWLELQIPAIGQKNWVTQQQNFADAFDFYFHSPLSICQSLQNSEYFFDIIALDDKINPLS